MSEFTIMTEDGAYIHVVDLDLGERPYDEAHEIVSSDVCAALYARLSFVDDAMASTVIAAASDVAQRLLEGEERVTIVLSLIGVLP